VILRVGHTVRGGVLAIGVTVENSRIKFGEKRGVVRDLSRLGDIPKLDIPVLV